MLATNGTLSPDSNIGRECYVLDCGIFWFIPTMRFARFDTKRVVFYNCPHHHSSCFPRGWRDAATNYPCPCGLKSYVSTICWVDYHTGFLHKEGEPLVQLVLVHEDNLDNWLITIASLIDDQHIRYHNLVK